jgi:hypothetical protein
LSPIYVGGAFIRSGPGDEHTVEKPLRAELVKKRMGRLGIGVRRHPPPMFEREKPFGFGAGQSQSRSQAIGVFLNPHS